MDTTYRLGINVSMTTLAQSGTVVFSNSNGISFGMSRLGTALVVTASATGLLASAIQSISAGTTQITSGQVVLSNSNGMNFGVSGQTVTGDLGAISYWDNHIEEQDVIDYATSRNVSLQRHSFGARMSATQANIVVGVFVTNQAGTYSLSLGLYTMSGSTASLASSASLSVSWSSGTTTSATSLWGGQSGARLQTLALGTWGITPGDYFIAFGASAAGTSASNPIAGPFRFAGSASQQQVSAATLAPYFQPSMYSTSTTALPSSIQLSDLQLSIANANAQFGQPFLQLVGTF